MTEQIIMEIDTTTLDRDVAAGTKPWVPVGPPVTAQTQPGSFSSEEPEGRQVYTFGWYNDESGLWRSIGGADIEIEENRQIFSKGLELVSDLAEPYCMELRGPLGVLNIRLLRIEEKPNA